MKGYKLYSELNVLALRLETRFLGFSFCSSFALVGFFVAMELKVLYW